MSMERTIDVALYLSALCRTFRRYVRSLAPDTTISILGPPSINKEDIQRQVREWKEQHNKGRSRSSGYAQNTRRFSS